MALDLETAYKTILAAAKQGKFLAYGDLAKAQGVEWGANRNQIFAQLGKLLGEMLDRNWPLLPAMVVNAAHVEDGLLEGNALTGFINDVVKRGVMVNDHLAYLRAEQARVFAWAKDAPDSLGAEFKGPKFIQYYDPVLDALRALGGSASPKAVNDWIRTHGGFSEEELTRLTKAGKSSFHDRIAWARFYLTKAGLMESKGRGSWSLTPKGTEAKLGAEGSLALFKEVRKTEGYGTVSDDEPAPDLDAGPASDLFSDPERQFWFAGAQWDGADDQTERFIKEGIWQNGFHQKFHDVVKSIKVGDRIAIKSSFVRKYGLPFANNDQPVSGMKIKAIGVVTANHGDGLTVDVDWKEINPAREWYFYTYRKTLARADLGEDFARRLVRFAFDAAPQDYGVFLKAPYWAKKYAVAAAGGEEAEEAEEIGEDLVPVDEVPATYSVADFLAEGCFLSEGVLSSILGRLGTKKNLVLQGPPGTGKTWLAKRLAKALIGLAKPGAGQIRSVQFHPSLAYEDFVRGWRPSAEGKLTLTDGVFLEIIEAAKAQPDLPHVLIIEEINRGNPAQLFGEMLTLLEDTKRMASEALELAYRRYEGEKVYLPENLHEIGTMNVADRSLALVDLALRRRFAFVSLEPTLNDQWRAWCKGQGLAPDLIEAIAVRMEALNKTIAEDRSLGPQFRVGHSYVTPGGPKSDPLGWFQDVVASEIRPLLEEYWYDAPEKAAKAADALGAAL